MTKKHRILFKIWKIYMWMKGLRKGTFVKTWSQEKEKFIQGCIVYLEGDSIDEDNYGFDFGVKWFEPVQGNDSRYYSQGSYSYNSFRQNKIEKWS